MRPANRRDDPWRIAAVSRLSIVTGLYRLSLNTARSSTTFTTWPCAPPTSRSRWRQDARSSPKHRTAPTAVVLLGRGRMRFTPPDPAERTQVRIFAGGDALVAEIDMAFLRFSPAEFESRFDTAALQPRPVDPSDLRTATTVFNDYVGRTLQIDLARHQPRSLVAEPVVRRRHRRAADEEVRHAHLRAIGQRSGRHHALRSQERRRNISVYASAAKLARARPLLHRGRAARLRRAGVRHRRGDHAGSRIDRRQRAAEDQDAQPSGVSSLTFRLAESLTVRGVYSPEFGRLLHLRVVGQNSLIVNLPGAARAGHRALARTSCTAGRVAPQSFDREAIQIGQQQAARSRSTFRSSSASSTATAATGIRSRRVTDYATANIRITVPSEFDVVATGDPVGPPDAAARRRDRPATAQDVRVRRGDARRGTWRCSSAGSTGRFDARISAGGTDVVAVRPEQPAQRRSRVRDMTRDERRPSSSSTPRWWATRRIPASRWRIAESDRPGGHSPPYFAVLNQVVAGSPFVWRNDPVSFENYPTFFLAHEVAHQWWGHAVGWKNYHEQWLSEGFAQYFAALYAEKDREGDRAAEPAAADAPHGDRCVRARARSTSATVSATSRGTIAIFRALVYNKGAMVLHMLRRLVGDEAFFAGVRDVLRGVEVQEGGHRRLPRAMEKATGRDLQRFFETWIFGTEHSRTSSSAITSRGPRRAVRFDQQGDPVDIPITVTRHLRVGDHARTIGGRRWPTSSPSGRFHAEGTRPRHHRQRRQRRTGGNRTLSPFFPIFSPPSRLWCRPGSLNREPATEYPETTISPKECMIGRLWKPSR